MQMFFYPTFENIYACVVVYAGWTLLRIKIITKKNISSYPLVTLMFFALAFFYFYTEVFVTLFENKPVVYNLDSPILTFTLQLVYLLALYLAFLLFQKLEKVNVFHSLFRKINLYYSPTFVEVWLLGFIGVVSFFFSNGQSTVLAENRSSMDRFFEGFVFLTYLPIVFFSIPDGWNSLKKNPYTKYLVFLYIVVLIVCSVMTNRRHAIFGYILCPFLLWFFNSVRDGSLKNFKMTFIRFILIVFSAYFVFGPLTDFCLAMSVLRSRVHDIGGKELLMETWKTYNDKKALEAQYRFFSEEQIDFSKIGYTEYYVDNILLNRFCNMKPIDNSVKYMQSLDWFWGDDFMREKLIEKMLYLLPNPIIKLLGIDYNKFAEGSYGFHDYLINRAVHSRGGGYRVGGDAGIGFATFGFFFFPFVVLFYGVFFSFIHAFGQKGSNIISIFGVCQLYDIFYIFQSNHGFVDDLCLILRIWPQRILLFAGIIFLFKIFRVSRIGWSQRSM